MYVTLTKRAIIRQHFVQFQYRRAPHLLLTSNAYGLFINDSENFASRSVIEDLDHFYPKNRVNLLLPTVKYWSNEQSKNSIEAFIETFSTNTKCIANKFAFIHTFDCYKLHDFAKAVHNTRAKIITVNKIGKDDEL